MSAELTEAFELAMKHGAVVYEGDALHTELAMTPTSLANIIAEARATPAPGAPAGFKLVPIESTAAIEWAFRRADVHYRDAMGRSHPKDPSSAFRAQYAAMLDAAPGAPGQDAAAVQAVGAWIGIDERRPEMDEPVFVFNPNGPLHVSIDEWCIYREAPVSWSSATIETGEGWANHEFEQITHWMPLPALPAGAGEKTS